MNLEGVAEQANEEHVPTWNKLVSEAKISNTPLSPYIDKELLSNNHLCVDGSKICKETSFKAYTNQISQKAIAEQINFFVKQGVFPTMKLSE